MKSIVDEKKAVPVESNAVTKKDLESAADVKERNNKAVKKGIDKKKKLKKVGSYKEDILIVSGVLGLGLAAYWAWSTITSPRRRRR